MRLNKLLKVLPRYDKEDSMDPLITGISEDSRNIKKNFLFVAVKGFTVDGHKFISDVVKKGAVAVIGEKDKRQLKLPKDVAYVKVKNSRQVLGLLASVFNGEPSKKMKVIGVTGTKGKSTTVHLIYHILTKNSKKVGMVSSIEAKIGKRSYDTGLHVTNPDPVTLNRFLKKMVDNGCKFAVIEVSSHGIDQKRIAGIEFEIGVLTNIESEHLDYHKTFENYKKIKLSFIASAKKKVIAPKKTSLDILPGYFNNLNAEAAIKTAELIGINREKALRSLVDFKLPEGRMKSVKNDKGLSIIIDFAHNPSSLEAILTHFRKLKTKDQRLIAVFGCASERDDSKRPMMAEISTRLAEVSIFTAEDPRKEDIEKIFKEMEKGVDKRKAEKIDQEKLDDINNRSGKHAYLNVPERGEAITIAISKLAVKGDIVAILGKGHERSMSYNGVEYPWSDEKAVKMALQGKVLEIKRA